MLGTFRPITALLVCLLILVWLLRHSSSQSGGYNHRPTAAHVQGLLSSFQSSVQLIELLVVVVGV